MITPCQRHALNHAFLVALCAATGHPQHSELAYVRLLSPRVARRNRRRSEARVMTELHAPGTGAERVQHCSDVCGVNAVDEHCDGWSAHESWEPDVVARLATSGGMSLAIEVER
jgi:hypothetical protein